MSSLDIIHERLTAHWKVLQQRWQARRTKWDDVVAERFEREHWRECEHIVPATLKEMHEIAEVLAQARRKVR